MAVLAYVCTQYPDTQLEIIFLPFITFKADMVKFCVANHNIALQNLRFRLYNFNDEIVSKFKHALMRGIFIKIVPIILL